jgi:hypothetical protein
MIKKMRFCQDLTKKLITGEKTRVILPAPNLDSLDGFRMCQASADGRNEEVSKGEAGNARAYGHIVLDNRVYVVDKYHNAIGFKLLPIPLGVEVAVARSLSEYYADGKIQTVDKDDFAWRNRMAVNVNELKESFIATSVSIKRLSDVDYEEWRDNGYQDASDASAGDGDASAGGAEVRAGASDTGWAMKKQGGKNIFTFGDVRPMPGAIERFKKDNKLGSLPEYVYVFNVRMQRV